MTSEQAARPIIAQRAMDRCEIAIPGVCTGLHQSVHHRLKRSHGGSWAPSNLLASCGNGTTGCHGWVENHPAKAQALGLWLTAGQDPATTPVKLRWGDYTSTWLLDDDGMLQWVEGPFELVELAYP